jgi:hypothetical protein
VKGGPRGVGRNALERFRRRDRLSYLRYSDITIPFIITSTPFLGTLIHSDTNPSPGKLTDQIPKPPPRISDIQAKTLTTRTTSIPSPLTTPIPPITPIIVAGPDVGPAHAGARAAVPRTPAAVSEPVARRVVAVALAVVAAAVDGAALALVDVVD